MEPAEILKCPIHSLGLSEQFIESSRLMGFATIGEIVLCAPVSLIKKKGFSYTWLGELSTFLKEKGMLNLLQTASGSTAGLK